MQPFLRYQGGKSRIAKKIVASFPPHKRYVEPFVGGGSVLLAKPPAELDVISDKDKDLMTFWKALKKGEVKKCDMTPNEHKFDKLLKKKKKKPLAPCEYLYLNKLSYGALGTSFKVDSRQANCKGSDASGCGIDSKNHEAYKNRLSKVKIMRGDYEAIVKKYDSKDTLFYLDPPYAETNRSGYKHKDLQPEDVKKITDKIKGKLVLSYNDSSRIRNLFCTRDSKYNCKKIQTKYTMNMKKSHVPRGELLIKNYKCKRTKYGVKCEKIKKHN